MDLKELREKIDSVDEQLVKLFSDRRKIVGEKYAFALEPAWAWRTDVRPENVVDGIALRDAMNAFLGELPKKSRVVFMKRYFWILTVSEIAQSLGMSESAVKMTLSRVREKLKEYLKKEGFIS